MNLRYPPRLARLYSAEVRQLEARHAGALSPGTASWEDAIRVLYQRTVKAGPVKGVLLLKAAADYLTGTAEAERAHLMLDCGGRKRNARLVLATFCVGNHPDQAVREEGLVIKLHVVQVSRARPLAAIGIPVCFAPNHTVKRLFERGYDISGNADATNVFAAATALGYLAHISDRHDGGGLYLRIGNVLLAGAVHGYNRTHNGNTFPSTVYDVRTCLEADEIGPARQHQLDQGEIALDVVREWFAHTDDIDDVRRVERIPALPRRADHFSARSSASAETGR